MAEIWLNLPQTLCTTLQNVDARLQQEDSRGSFISLLDPQAGKPSPFHIVLLTSMLHQSISSKDVQEMLAQLQRQQGHLALINFQLTRWNVVSGCLRLEVSSDALTSLAAAVGAALKQEGSVATAPFYITVGKVSGNGNGIMDLLKSFPIPQHSVFQARCEDVVFMTSEAPTTDWSKSSSTISGDWSGHHTQSPIPSAIPLAERIGDGAANMNNMSTVATLEELESAPPQTQWNVLGSMLMPLVQAELTQKNLAPSLAESVAPMILRAGFPIKDLFAMASGADPKQLQMAVEHFLGTMRRPQQQQPSNNLLGLLFSVGSLQIRGGMCEPRQLRMELWGGGQRATWTDFIDELLASSSGRLTWNTILQNIPFQAFMLEMPPLCKMTASLPFEMVAIDTKEDEFKPLHRSTFKLVHQKCITSAAFQAKNPKTGAAGSTRFITPGDVAGRRYSAAALDPEKRRSVDCCAHLAKFAREGTAEQQEDFWCLVHKELKGRLMKDTCTWVSTEGTSVHWLHLRLARGPLHFTHAPYKLRPPSSSRRASPQRSACRFFAEGRCLKGALCRFSHLAPSAMTKVGSNKTTESKPAKELPASHPATLAGAKPCWFFQQGSCRFGRECRKAHVMSPSAQRQRQ